jgi:hypothetical protein
MDQDPEYPAYPIKCNGFKYMTKIKFILTGGDKPRPLRYERLPSIGRGGVYPRPHKPDCPNNNSIKILLQLKIRAGVNRFRAKTYFLVREFKDLRLMQTFNL